MGLRALLLLLRIVAVCAWIEDPAAHAAAAARQPTTPKRFTLNLDLPADQRWVSIYADPLFKNAAADLQGYFAANVPKWSVPILERIAKNIRGHFEEYGDEMVGVAKAMNADIGVVALVNLVYALESIAEGGCEVMNTTGPCKPQNLRPGLCTSVVAEAADGSTWHGRNLDWNLPQVLRKYVFDFDAVLGGKHVYRATTVAGLVGALHGIRPGGFSVSMDARNDGGNSFANILKFITGEHFSATHLLRNALETQGDFAAGLGKLSSTVLVEPVYFIVGGPSRGQGAVVARKRNPPAADLWFMNQTTAGWFALQTNYDRNTTIPTWDDRQTPGVAHMQALGQPALNGKGLKSVMTQWPTFNDHTDITAVLGVTGGSYESIVWMDAAFAGVLTAIQV